MAKVKIAAVILAAGEGTRMGRTKQLLPWGESTLLGKVIDLFVEAKIHDIIVVVGHAASQICEALKDKPVRWVINEEYKKGMSTSLKKGIAALVPEVQAAFIALGDTPLVRPATVIGMMKKFAADGAEIIIPCYQEKQGHPVLFSRKLFSELLTVTGDKGARDIIRKHEDKVCRFLADDPGILQDVDTWLEYVRLYKGGHDLG